MRPADLPPPERFAHGTNARYANGCRCRPCRRGHSEDYHARERRLREARAEIKPNDLPALYVTIYRRSNPVEVLACPGTGGHPCVKGGTGLAAWLSGAWLKNGDAVCHDCAYRATVWNGFVSAAAARHHIRDLGEKGVGGKAVAAASDVAYSTITAVLSGAKPRIRRRTEQRILAVDEGARADGSQVPAKRSFEIIDELRAMGFTWAHLSRELGFKDASGAHALRHGKACIGSGRTYVRKTHERDEVLARTALRIEKLYRRVVAGEIRPTRWKVDGAETWKLVDELLKGFSQKQLADRLGLSPAALRDRRRIIRPTTRDAVRRLHDELLAAHREGGPLPEGWQTSARPVTPMGAEEWALGGWSMERRTSKAAKKREKEELRKLARSAA